jgi:acetylornithine deacetylase/succinyl-diaminopimelate desuccinylase-like protein
MMDAAFDPAAIAADAVVLAGLDGGTGRERVRIDWQLRPAGRSTSDGSAGANAALAAGIPAVALGCAKGENMHVPTERIRADSIVTGARQLRAVLQEVPEPLVPRGTGS